MRYAELPLPPQLHGLAVAIWTLEAEGAAGDWIEHAAAPDGCVEIIRRHAGRSIWHREQPETFVTGLSEHPVALRFSSDARFTGIRLWPWAWEALGGQPCPGFADDWIEAPPALAALTKGDIPANLTAALPDAPAEIARAILTSHSVAELATATGLQHRALQRWFATHIGMPPRSYLRLLRFRDAIGAVHNKETLADTAAAHGYADQAHMARDFRALAGVPPREARVRAKGPFI
ncbi:MAG: helix-turn-helix domain-containing protein [Pseudomonadota bacterium]